ncbi:MAG: ATPase domain-containing protein [Planctomycetota bacterium]
MGSSSVLNGRLATGTRGLDYVLRGGLPKRRIHLVHGGPGTGKTTLALQFLRTGACQGERALYVTLLQTKDELLATVRSHGWDLDGVDVLELPADVRQSTAQEQTLFTPADIELNEATDAVLRAIEEYRPQRLVFDSLTEFAALVETPYQFRRQVLRLREQLSRADCTTLLTIATGGGAEAELESLRTMVHGVIALDSQAPLYGQPRRRLEVSKMRGMPYLEGYHDMRIRTGGIEVYPRLEVPTERRKTSWDAIPSGNERLDAMLGGGLERGTACLLTGTTGAGKSSLASLYVQSSAQRGEHAAIFCFDERRETFLRRSTGLGMEIARFVDEGLVDLRQVNAGNVSPGEFMQIVRRSVDQDGARVVVIDSLSGYLNAMPEERHLMVQLHELLSYLSAAGVLTLLVVASHGGIVGHEARIDASYVADAVLLVRHFEARGEIRRCLSVLKKRHGPHENTIREIRMSSAGIEVGEPLREFSGVLTGKPSYHGLPRDLMDRPNQGEREEQRS